ncbi:ABC transporter permease [Flavobacterium beibuense]|uniref:Putative acyl carrier protein involved in flexirubin-type pigment biosynthesis DarC2 n=1 Tax=Flavobacterium beibuense TaxID=657326 RepID=A0A444WD55_9FLAO|nr:ABC transporter permease [Flavobacterium beibuense]RYJ43757.1 putative acyl carrier protein involved in flexirubin-type pigment biosynthesis DarC2 [Flavobacterium beibuense]
MANTIEIQKYLPHRTPMLMVDLIVSMDHENVKTIFTIAEDNIFVENGQFVEAGLVENAAQTCSAIVGSSYFVNEEGEDIPGVRVIGFISSIKSVKIYALPKVGTEITTTAVLQSSFDMGTYTTCTMQCTTYNGETLLLEGDINLFIQQR